MDWRALTALHNNTGAKFNLALAFRELAENAGKIGTLNIRPELLETILNEEKTAETKRCAASGGVARPAVCAILEVSFYTDHFCFAYEIKK
ncbi:hypothetical protein AGMMS50239_18410 [Bacteroidia bacterium]|nr:hypothetical protein AGMMS50239_18410 [Bacteroidia bacterium]